ncbi:hypothetical protein H6G33_04435 [Calothrix sp. FACHB-1219]|uniref:hypothetical protein n=1 Tax=unclassified Calothrix TaxID=2619626 RepID=UPI00168A2059|nr:MULTISPECIES: hypothetical protein [unclassified Calothrix]MBD2204899.1 hypothetical protein [Calothrix sp. FACHB-168]MBD2216275.1 hypothetical protein [Calothrix sp. FACHB-1219]
MNIMKSSRISVEILNDYQLLQMQHDKIYHYEIVALGISRRMNHIVLHLVKYLGILSSMPASSRENSRAFIDSFIMIVSASNLLGISLAKEVFSNKINYGFGNFIDEYIHIIAELAKACEATDHQEDYPIRATWNKNIIKFFLLLIREAESRNISIIEESSRRLVCVEMKHSLNDILQVKQ